MTKKTVFITRQICEPGIDLLKSEGYDVQIWKEKETISAEELIQRCKSVDALISAGYIKINAHFLNECKHLKVISLHSVGYDHADIKEANKLKIPIGHITNILSDPTADIAFLLMLAVSRKAFSQYSRIKNGDWVYFEPSQHLGLEIKGKTLGIFGMGSIGFQMAKRAHLAYDMTIIYCSRTEKKEAEEKLNARRVSFEELLKQSDVLSVHANLSAETRQKFNLDTFKTMKRNAIFINTARGAIHNEQDLIFALEKKLIWGAGLDVTNPEPMKKDNPLLEMPNVAVLPHIGSATIETRNAMSVMAAENVIAALNNKRIPYPVNPEVYD